MGTPVYIFCSLNVQLERKFLIWDQMKQRQTQKDQPPAASAPENSLYAQAQRQHHRRHIRLAGRRTPYPVLDEVQRQSTCELEVDAVAVDVLNRLEIENQIGRNPGLQAIWEDEKQRRREKNQPSQIETPESQDRGFVTSSESEKIFMKRVEEILKENEFDVTQDLSAGDGENQEDFPGELTLHFDP
ncbi:DNA polymerase zeta catalytic subunit-like [Oreochromis aureus]|uniref:DNA polymerase zeta catalytic subunit-like n=1 Tax=Oreochromis aureus TaxID=47969 RepID=UPI001953E22F|nr:DNA polymerase zeta catalytic subunit-like [Oreochromis aureus]